MSFSILMRGEFVSGLRSNLDKFDLELTDDVISRLADYYELVQNHNPHLHLVAPCSPAEFATRHILESLTTVRYLRENAGFADIGTGAGLPAIPCLIARQDLHAVLIESKAKKAGFLQTALAECQLLPRAEVIGRQFSETPRPDVSYVTCRALDKFIDNMPRLLKWSGDCTLLFFGGPALGEQLESRVRHIEKHLMPMSEQRFLFVAKR